MVSDQLLNTVYARAYGAAQQRLAQEAELQRYNQERRDRTTLAANNALIQNMRFLEEAKRADRDYVFNIAKELGQYTGEGVQGGDTDVGRAATVGAKVGAAGQQRQNAVLEAKRQQALEKLLAEYALGTKRDAFKSKLRRGEEDHAYDIRAGDRSFDQDVTAAELNLRMRQLDINQQRADAASKRAQAAAEGKLGTKVSFNNQAGQVEAGEKRAFDMQREALEAALDPRVQQYLTEQGMGAAMLQSQMGVDSRLLAIQAIANDPTDPGYAMARQYLNLLERTRGFAQSREPMPWQPQPAQQGVQQPATAPATEPADLDRRERLRRSISGGP